MLKYEEVNEDLGLTFTYTWATADKFGIVRKCQLANNSNSKVRVRVLDGLQNIVAANTDGYLQDCMSNLLDAYKWNELVDEQVGVFCLYAKLSGKDSIEIPNVPSALLYLGGEGSFLTLFSPFLEKFFQFFEGSLPPDLGHFPY